MMARAATGVILREDGAAVGRRRRRRRRRRKEISTTGAVAAEAGADAVLSLQRPSLKVRVRHAGFWRPTKRNGDANRGFLRIGCEVESVEG